MPAAEVAAEDVVFVDVNDNLDKPTIDGIVQLRPTPTANQPDMTAHQAEVSLQEILARPKPRFLEDEMLARVVSGAVGNDPWSKFSTINDLIIFLNKSVSQETLSPISAWNKGRLLEPLTFEVLEYCWYELKRLGKLN